MDIILNYADEDTMPNVYNRSVKCLLLYTILENPYVLLIPSCRGQTYKRISVRDTSNVGMSKAELKSFTVRWFNNARQEEIVII